nr:3-dehydroshikimate dehydratase [Quercus suber]
MHYEGLRDRVEHARRIEEMELWISLTQILDTKIIAIPSTSLGTDVMTGDLDVIDTTSPTKSLKPPAVDWTSNSSGRMSNILQKKSVAMSTHPVSPQLVT